MSGRGRPWSVAVFLFSAVCAVRLFGQVNKAPTGINWVHARISKAFVGVEVETEMETRQHLNSSVETGMERRYLAPTVGLDLEGFVYHPNFLRFVLATETGVGFQDLALRGPAQAAFTGSRKERSLLHRYGARFTFLQEKPYATTLVANRARNSRDADFFSRVIVDSQGYGGFGGYSRGVVPVTFAITHREEAETGLSRSLAVEDETLSFTARHDRGGGLATMFAYTFNRFTRDQPPVFSDMGVNQTASFFDNSAIGKDARLALSTSLFYNEVDRANLPSRSLSGQEFAVLTHSSSLQSHYMYSFDRRDSGAVESGSQNARIRLRHQLYESLTSSVEIDGHSFGTKSPQSTLANKGYGGGLSESYSKRLQSWGKLTVGYSGRVAREHRETTGELVHVVQEQHTLVDGRVVFLKQPQVTRGSIRVESRGGTIVYQEGLDYIVVDHGPLTEIARVAGSTRIPAGDTVAVDYEAAAAPSSSVITNANQGQVRINLFNGLLGLYARVNRSAANASEFIVVQNISDKVAGADASWRWLHAGAEYQVFDSNLAPYELQRVFGVLTFEPSSSSIVTLDFGQSRHFFRDIGIHQLSRHLIGRVKWRAAYAISCEIEAGVRTIEGLGLNQNLTTIRALVEFAYGRLSASVGYDFQEESFIGELRRRQYVFLRAKRSF